MQIIINLLGMSVIVVITGIMFTLSIYPQDYRGKDTASLLLSLSLCMVFLISLVQFLKLLKY